MRVIPFGIIFAIMSCNAAKRDPLEDVPRVVLWAWEEPEDLSWIDPHEVAVAFFAGNLRFTESNVSFTPRLRSLDVPNGTRLIAVVRVEGTTDAAPIDQASTDIAEVVRLPKVRAVQIDFDALASQRDLYADLTRRVHAKLPPSMPLLTTALVSWCTGDLWLHQLDIAAAVPMYFRMGTEQGLISAPIREPLCTDNVGLSTDELQKSRVVHRVFLFHPQPWTRDALRTALSELRR